MLNECRYSYRLKYILRSSPLVLKLNSLCFIHCQSAYSTGRGRISVIHSLPAHHHLVATQPRGTTTYQVVWYVNTVLLQTGAGFKLLTYLKRAYQQ